MFIQPPNLGAVIPVSACKEGWGPTARKSPSFKVKFMIKCQDYCLKQICFWQFNSGLKKNNTSQHNLDVYILRFKKKNEGREGRAYARNI